MMFQNWPWMLYGGLVAQICRTWSTASRIIAGLAMSMLPKISASNGIAPGLIPSMKRPPSRWYSIAISLATGAG